MRRVRYGVGGFDPAKPNNNVVEDVNDADPPPPPGIPAVAGVASTVPALKSLLQALDARGIVKDNTT